MAGWTVGYHESMTRGTLQSDHEQFAPGVPRESRRATRAVHRVQRATTRPTIAILVAIAVVAMWVVVIASGFDEQLQLGFATVCAGITLVMVFVLQHTQRREQTALQLKLDELVRAMPQADDHLIGVEVSPDDELLARQQRHLEEHVGMRAGDD